jgi:Ca2+-transporting ATPase
MKLKPRNPKESFFAHGAGVRAVIGGVLIGLFTLLAFYYGLTGHGYQLGSGMLSKEVLEEALPYARTMSFVVLAGSQLFYSLSMRSSSKSIFKVGLFTNKFLIGAIIIGFLLQLVVISVPVLSTAFGVHSLSLQEWGIVILFALIPLAANEIIKIFMRNAEQK